MALRVLELFGGIGAFTQAVKSLDLPLDVVDYVEINPYSVKSYNAINDTQFEPQDITQFHATGGKYSNIDIIMHGSPCFTEDALVLTKDGYKKIIDVKVGDYVLTHENTYEKVVNCFDNGVKEVMKLKVPNADVIKVTPNHKFWVRSMKYKSTHTEKGTRSQMRTWSEPYWKEAKDLTKTDYIGYAINQNSIIPDWHGVECKRWTNTYIKKELNMEDENLWYLVGRYLGDGWTRVRNDRGGNISGVIICCGKDHTEEFASKIPDYFPYTLVHDRTADKFQFSNRELGAFCAQFGHGAANKFIPGFVFDMPVNLIKALLQGYQDSDGYVNDDDTNISSINPVLLFGTAQLLAKVYHYPSSIVHTSRPKQCVIEGRTVNQKDSWALHWRTEEQALRREMIYEDGYVWYPVRSIEPLETPEHVYDIEVENAHSFTAYGCIAHNCTSFSCAGKQEGGREGSGTASSLLYETVRIVEECKPKVVIWENVPMLVSNKFKHTFMDYLRRMIAMGYRSYYKVLNAKDYGVPQNRERVFTISILGEHKPYVFPEKEPLTKRLIDVLEKNVDESYYLSDKMIEKFTWTKNGYLAAQKAKTDSSKPSIRRIGDLNKGGQRGEVLGASGVCTTLSATDYKQPKQIIEPLSDDTERIMQVGNCYQREGRDNPNDGRVYAPQGLAPTLNTMNGGNRQPYVALEADTENSRVLTEFEGDRDGLIPVRENTVKGYDCAKEYDTIDTSYISSNTRHSRILSQLSHAVMTSGNEQVVVEPMEHDSVDAVGCAIRNRDDGEHLEFRDDNLVSALHGNLMKSMVATPNVITESKPKRQIRRIGFKQEQPVEQVETDEQKTGAVLTAQSVDPDAVIDVIDGTKKGFASIDTSYTKWNRRRGRVQKDVAHTLVTSGNEQAVVVPAEETVDAEIKHVGWIEGNEGKTHQSGAVYGTTGIAPSQCVGKGAITRIMEENPEPLIVASRGRIVGENTNSKGGVWTQQLEVNDRGICNTISTVQKDNYVVEPTSSVKFRIRRLQPIECWRLMGFSDEAFQMAKSVNPNSQLYSQAGNSICVPVLARMVEQLLKSVDFEGLQNNDQKSEPSQS